MRLVAVAAVAAAAGAGITASPVSADSVTAPTTVRVAGADRIATSVAISQVSHPAPSCSEPSPPGPACPAQQTPLSEVVILARADEPAEALLSAGLAGQLGAPVLLNERDLLSPAVSDEVARLGARRVVLLGGPAALFAQVERDLREQHQVDVQRIAGADRDETAKAVASSLDASGVIVVGRDAAADATAVSALAARLRWPVLPVFRDRIPPAVLDFLRSRKPEQAIVVGGENVVSEKVLTEIAAQGAAVERIAGPDRWATSIAVAERSYKAGLAVSTRSGPTMTA